VAPGAGGNASLDLFSSILNIAKGEAQTAINKADQGEVRRS
jgi:hypothetical protein